MEFELGNWEFRRVRFPPQPPRQVEPEEMIGCLWPFLRFFRLFGLCPIERSGTHLVVPHRVGSIGWGCTIALLLVHSALLFNETNDMTLNRDTVHGILFRFTYFCHVVPTCWYMILKTERLREFVSSFCETEIKWRKYPGQNDGLISKCFKIFVFFIAQHFLAIALYYTVQVRADGYFGEYLRNLNSPLLKFGSYYTGCVIWLCQLFSDVGWNFGDIFMTLMAVILTKYYERFNAALKKRRLMMEFDEIEELRADHQSLNMMVVLCKKTFGWLFFWIYIGNMAYVFGRFNLLTASWKNDWASDADSLVWVEILWRLLVYQVGIRLLLPSYFASRLYEEVQKARQTVEKWPSLDGRPYERNRLLLIRRFEDQLDLLHIGFRPLGYFLITRDFMVSMLGNLLGYCIMILQYHTSE